MRAKVSIPAWAKVALSALGVAAVLALVTMPGWRPRVDQCAALNENVELVRSGRADLRVSDAWIHRERRDKYGWSQTTIVGEPGEFGGYLTQFTLRSCLGEAWIEDRPEHRQEAWVREAWLYHRQDWPYVEYRVGLDEGLRTQIVIRSRP